MGKRHRVHLLLAAGALSAYAGVAQAEEAVAAGPQASSLEEVVVTARRREENLQDVPLAVTALTSESLREKQIRTSADVQFATPSLSIGGGPAYSQAGGNYSIRGLGQGLFGPSSVTSYFSEVPGGPSGPGAPLFDIQSVQVLKGPQGTLFGRATVGGAVLITPNRPSMTDISGYARAAVGSLGETVFEGAVGGPVVDDKLAVRIAAYRSHSDGYVSLVNSGEKLHRTNADSVRIGVLWKPVDRFENYALGNLFQTHGTPGALVLSGTDPNFALYNLPAAGTPAGLAAGTATFGAVCNNAIRFGLSPDLASCVNTRLGVVNNIRATLQAELARQAAGGSVRRISASSSIPLFEKSEELDFIDIAKLELGNFLGSDVSVKNVFGYIRSRNITVSDDDGTSVDVLQSGFSGSRSGAALPGDFGTASTNQLGNQPVPALGKWGETFTNEIQLSGETANNTLIWVAGYYYQYSPLSGDTSGVGNLNKVLGGVLTPNIGYAASLPFPVDGYNRSQAFYGQFTLDLSSFLIEGLKFTAGYRKTHEKQTTTSAAAVFNYPSGLVTPGAQTTVVSKSSGPGYNLTLDYQINKDLLVYVAHRKGYRPGGVNNLVGAESLPQFSRVYGPETIKDIEVGAKWDFAFPGGRGRLNVDYYSADYTNIQRTFRGITALGTSATYFVNVGGQSLKGFEAEGNLLFGDHFAADFQYSHNGSKNDSWVASDPLNKVPGFIDLASNPIPNSPRDKGSVTLSYAQPLSPGLGDIRASVTLYRQARVWFTDSGFRQMEFYGAGIRDAISQKPYSVANARIDWNNAMDSGVDAAIYVRNLTDETYAYSGNPQLQSLGIANKIYAAPRTWGFELLKTF